MNTVKLNANTDLGYTQSVRNITNPENNARLIFTFAEFKLSPVSIQDEFNNYYASESQFAEKMALLLEKALPLLSRETASLFSKEHGKAETLHLHRVTNRREIVEKILIEYGFSSDAINDKFEGQELYQLEVPYANGSTRIIFQRIDNLISFLFVDPNHHVYFDPLKVEAAGSLYYEYCPVNQEKLCARMDYFDTCYAFEYLDEKKYRESFDCAYYPST